MKSVIISLMILSMAGPALAIEPAELDNRIRTLTDKFESFQHLPDKCIPPATLRKARGIILLDRTKAGFLFAYQGGGGVAMVRDAHSDQWSPVAFLDANEASLGFQIGGEQHFYIVLLMTTNSTWMLLDQTFELGGEARGTAGNNSSGVEAAPPAEPAVLVYDDRQGLYAGATVKAGAVTPADAANRVYYGQYLTMGDILFGHKAQPSGAAANLAKKVEEYSQSYRAGINAAK